MNTENIYTVEIKDCSGPGLYWYAGKIGSIFRCHKRRNNSLFWPSVEIYTTTRPLGNNGMPGNILPQDCKIIKIEEIPNINAN